jgi:hypothetical protein
MSLEPITMSSLRLCCIVLTWLVACSNDVDPRIIPGGGIGDGEIDGELNVHVIDSAGDTPIANATVRVGDVEGTTTEKGLVTFADVEGAQTVVVKASGYRSTVWVGANGANVTIPLNKLATTPADSATLSGTIPGYSSITVPAQHIKAALVFYSQTDQLGDAANELMTPNNGNICFGDQPCTWNLVSRTGAVTVIAAIIDRDTKGTVAEADDTQTVIGWAFKGGITVEKGVDQSGMTLDMVEAGNIETVTIDYGTPPAGLPEKNAIVGIELSKDEVIQIPFTFFMPDETSFPVPKPSVFASGARYRLSAIANMTSGDMGAQSILLERGLSGPTLTAGEWLVPPTNVNATRTSASFDRVANAKVHGVTWSDATGEILEITLWNNATTVDVPSLVALPSSGMLRANVSGIGADIDVGDFSLEEDIELLWGIAGQPTTIQ